MAKALTVKGLEHIEPGTFRREIPDGLMTGLFHIVQPSGARSWAVRYRAAGIPRKMTLGTYPAIDLVTARELAKEALRAVAKGKDPSRAKLAERSAERAGADTIEVVAEDFVERHAKKHTRESSWKEAQRILNSDVVPAWKKHRIGQIRKRDVIALLDTVTDRGSTIMANRVLATVRRMFSWAVERDLIETSPCVGIRAPAAERSRDRVLSDAELALIWKAADVEAWPFGRLVQMLALTGQRRDEVAGMTKAELDIEGKLWTLSRERAKNNVAHTVPLSDVALKVLSDLPKIKSVAGLVFTTNGKTPISGFSRAKEHLDEAIAEIQARDATPGHKPKSLAPWTFHDLRRTMSTNLARLGQPIHVVEAVLNHKSGTIRGVAAIYNRHDYAAEKRLALDAWGRHLSAIVNGETESNVVTIGSARRR